MITKNDIKEIDGRGGCHSIHTKNMLLSIILNKSSALASDNG